MVLDPAGLHRRQPRCGKQRRDIADTSLFLRDFGATPVVLGLGLGAKALSQFAAAPFLGRLSDIFGCKPVLLASQAGALTSLVLLGLGGMVGPDPIRRAVRDLADRASLGRVRHDDDQPGGDDGLVESEPHGRRCGRLRK